MRFRFHPDAEIEFMEAIDYYERIDSGLGLDFAIDVHEAISRAYTYSNSWARIQGDIRRSLVDRFPFGILYEKKDGMLYILAVMHLHREPNYCVDRLI